MLNPETQALLRLAADAAQPKMHELSVEALRRFARETVGVMDGAAAPVKLVRDVLFESVAESRAARIYWPERLAAADVILFFHGGGWVAGDLDSHDALCRRLVNQLGLRLVAIDYRLAPEHPFPAAYEDAVAAARWVASSPRELDQEVTGLVLAGDSAGGNLAASVAAQCGSSLPLKAQLLLYPVTDLAERAPSYESFGAGYLLEAADMSRFIKAYAPDPVLRADPRASPLRGPLESVPPTVIVTAGVDVLRDEGRAYARRLIEQGIETHFYEAAGYPHGWGTARAVLPSVELVLARALTSLLDIILMDKHGR